MEYELFTEYDVSVLFQEAASSNTLKEELLDPIFSVLETKQGRDKYIALGNEFLEANSEMLAKEYPTKAVSFPRKYVNSILELFGFDLKRLKDVVKNVLKEVGESDFTTITASPTNVIHTIALSYSDMILHRELRDSARLQTGLTIYSLMWSKYFGHIYDEKVMAYTYSQLNGTWKLVKAGNMINWIGEYVDTTYAFYKTKLTINMSAKALVVYLNRLRSSFNQGMKLLCDRFRKDMSEGNTIAVDSQGDDSNVEVTQFTTIRDNLIRIIRNGDPKYKKNGELYAAIARFKNVKCQSLYDLAQSFEYDDIATIVDTILYVFITKEGNSLDDINTTKYINRISNLPTAIDRAITGKPIIDPMSDKYKCDPSIMRAYICFIATYLMYNIGDCIPD